VVDTISRKAYCHHPLISQEQPLSMRISCDLFKKLPLMVSLSLEVLPLLDDRLMAILKLDIGIHNIGIKVSKCFLVNLLESFSCGNNSIRSKSTLWMVSDTLLATAPFFVYTWFSNQLIHCVNSSVTWWPKTLNHECFTIRPIQRCALCNSTPWLTFHPSLAIVSPFPLGYPSKSFTKNVV
jgi:hypothetical protein